MDASRKKTHALHPSRFKEKDAKQIFDPLRFTEENAKRFELNLLRKQNEAVQAWEENKTKNLPPIETVSPKIGFLLMSRQSAILMRPLFFEFLDSTVKNGIAEIAARQIEAFCLSYRFILKSLCESLQSTDYLSKETIERFYKETAKLSRLVSLIKLELGWIPSFEQQGKILNRFLKASKPINESLKELSLLSSYFERRIANSTAISQIPPPLHPSKSLETGWTHTTKAEFDKLLKTNGYPTRETCFTHQGEPGFPEIEYAKGKGKNRMMKYRFLERLESPKKSIE